MSELLETLDKDKQAMSESLKKDLEKDIEKDKESLARAEADESEKGYEKDDGKKHKSLTKKSIKTKIAATMTIFMKRTIEQNEIKKETTPSVIKKKPKMMHAWSEPMKTPLAMMRNMGMMIS